MLGLIDINGCTPVAKAPFLFLTADKTALTVSHHIINIFEHIGQVLLNHIGFAIGFVEHIRDNNYCTAPGSRTATTAAERRCVLNVTCFNVLTVGNITHPFSVKLFTVSHKHNRFGAKLTVTRIAKTLDMRTVGRHTAMHIVKLCAQIGLIKPVEHLIVALKAACYGTVGMCDVYRNDFGVV